MIWLFRSGKAAHSSSLRLPFALSLPLAVALIAALGGSSPGARGQAGLPASPSPTGRSTTVQSTTVQSATVHSTTAESAASQAVFRTPFVEVPVEGYSAPSAPAKPSKLARIKDVATVEGIRDNQLVGYGLVVGLHGTGDSTQAVFPVQTLIATLERMGVTLPQTGGASTLRVQNMAAVFVTATMGPFLRPGSLMDLTISSAGDARSLEGGVLLMTPLYGPDGQIYAQGQGPLVLGGYEVTSNGNSKQFNHPTTGRIPNGAIVERPVPLELKQMKSFSLLLNEEDFRTAERLAAAINTELKRPMARVVDSRRIDLAPSASEDIPALLAAVEAVEVEVYPRAKVVVNERTGTVVIGGDVRLQPVSILHGGLEVNVVSELQVSQPGPLSAGTTEVVRQTQVQAQDRPVNRIELKQGATVDDLVQNLQQIGATARDIISILQAMKAAGALEAELEVL